VRVKLRGGDKKFLAKILAIGTECDLALLTVEDDTFWEDLKPLKLGPMPRLQESVAVVGCAARLHSATLRASCCKLCFCLSVASKTQNA
jgi:hypothetical protein